MNNLKLFLRLLLKIPLTPFVVSWVLVVLAVGHIIMFFEWLYDSDDIRYSKMVRVDYIEFLKNWFTTI